MAEPERLSRWATYPQPQAWLHRERFRWTGEVRAPKAGEWFLSGAIIEAYRAEHDLTTTYPIAQPVA